MAGVISSGRLFQNPDASSGDGESLVADCKTSVESDEPVTERSVCDHAHQIGRLSGVLVRTLDLRLSVAGSIPSNDTVRLFLR